MLPHPVFGSDSNSLWKFRRNESLKCQLLKYQSKSHAWPAFVYQQYDASFAADKIIQFLNKLKIGRNLFMFLVAPLQLTELSLFADSQQAP